MFADRDDAGAADDAAQRFQVVERRPGVEMGERDGAFAQPVGERGGGRGMLTARFSVRAVPLVRRWYAVGPGVAASRASTVPDMTVGDAR
ncbi:hypothetical protein ACFRKD_23905 [Streptomyces niveus]|uniref:hypothetical protein n=1 Tax=Streptomyces niveus TaxID=193462 RepID=UPI00367A5CF1